MSDFDHPVHEQLAQDAAIWQKSIDARLGRAKLTIPTGEAPPAITDRVPRGERRWAPLAVALAVACCILVVAAITWTAAHGLGGHGDEHVNAAIALPSAPASTDPLQPSRDPGLPPGGAATTVTTAAPGSTISMPWGLATKPSGSSLDVFYVAGGGCTTLLGAHIVEIATTVEVWVLSTEKKTRGACSSNLIVGRSTIELSEPLGTRTLLHPPSDPEWTRTFDATFPTS